MKAYGFVGPWSAATKQCGVARANLRYRWIAHFAIHNSLCIQLLKDFPTLSAQDSVIWPTHNSYFSNKRFFLFRGHINYVRKTMFYLLLFAFIINKNGKNDPCITFCLRPARAVWGQDSRAINHTCSPTPPLISNVVDSRGVPGNSVAGFLSKEVWLWLPDLTTTAGSRSEGCNNFILFHKKWHRGV